MEREFKKKAINTLLSNLTREKIKITDEELNSLKDGNNLIFKFKEDEDNYSEFIIDGEITNKMNKNNKKILFVYKQKEISEDDQTELIGLVIEERQMIMDIYIGTNLFFRTSEYSIEEPFTLSFPNMESKKYESSEFDSDVEYVKNKIGEELYKIFRDYILEQNNLKIINLIKKVI